MQKLEDTLGKNVEDLDRLFDMERDKSNLGSVDENIDALGSLTHTAEKMQSRTRRRDSLTELSMGEKTFMENASSASDNCRQQQQGHNTDGDHGLPDNIQTTFGERCRSAENVPSSMEEQPLDCTSDTSQLQQTKHEPLDYTMEMDTETRYKPHMAERILYNPEESSQRQGSDPSPALSTSFILDEAIRYR